MHYTHSPGTLLPASCYYQVGPPFGFTPVLNLMAYQGAGNILQRQVRSGNFSNLLLTNFGELVQIQASVFCSQMTRCDILLPYCKSSF